MFAKQIKKIIISDERKKIFGNFFSLSILQFTNYLIPLITLPYLARVLGPERFGIIAFAQAFIQYFTLLTDYGFNLTATREISINRNDETEISRIFISVMTIRFFLLALSLVTILLLISIIPKFNEEKDLFLLSFLAVVGTSMFPQWFYQGIEKMKFITIFSLSSKLIFTVAIFFLIKTEEDYLWTPFLNSMGYIVAGMIGLLYPFIYLKVSFSFPTLKELKFHLREGWHIFVSTVSINLYTSSNSVLLGFFTNNTIVGYYSAAERLFRAVQFLGMPIYQALFPHFSKLFVSDRKLALKQFKTIFRLTMFITFFISLFLTITSKFWIIKILGTDYQNSIAVFSILSWVIFSSWGNYTLGIQGMVNMGYKEIYSKVVLFFGILHLIILSISINIFGMISVPFVWFLTESFIFMYEIYFLRIKKLLFV